MFFIYPRWRFRDNLYLHHNQHGSPFHNSTQSSINLCPLLSQISICILTGDMLCFIQRANIPPPATMLLLFKLAPIVAKFPTAHILLARDYNMPPNLSMDKLNPDPNMESLLSCWAETYGLCDMWRWRHPRERQYTCQSSTYATLFLIDLIYRSNSLTSRTLDVSYCPVVFPITPLCF